jgi:membrane protease YdiL (CAAX protease family)
MRLGAVAMVVCVVAIATFFGFQPERSGTIAFWVIVGTPTVILAAMGAWRAHLEDDLAEWVKPRWGDFSRAFFAAAVMYGGAYAFARMFAATGSPREIWLVSLYAQLGDPRLLQKYAPAVGIAIVVTATAEEILWRGAVTRILEEHLGSQRAWIASAVLYALAHAPTMWSLRVPGASLNPLLVVAALGAGLVFGAMARHFGRLAPGIIAHALFDWVVVMMFPLWGLNRGF